ncbi:putative uncharacterized protein DDB_G0271606 [Cyclospora cayetanensis]|uniref:Uncharacterized protein n=1 Tax=Cyclospora cayetanensis TaxID=88456 RepID=A0A6P6S322_9EIME|nr:putative uncharacterized protein DDB_G0271606 [Cyclospora cayetanensis]
MWDRIAESFKKVKKKADEVASSVQGSTTFLSRARDVLLTLGGGGEAAAAAAAAAVVSGYTAEQLLLMLEEQAASVRSVDELQHLLHLWTALLNQEDDVEAPRFPSGELEQQLQQQQLQQQADQTRTGSNAASAASPLTTKPSEGNLAAASPAAAAAAHQQQQLNGSDFAQQILVEQQLLRELQLPQKLLSSDFGFGEVVLRSAASQLLLRSVAKRPALRNAILSKVQQHSLVSQRVQQQQQQEKQQQEKQQQEKQQQEKQQQEKQQQEKQQEQGDPQEAPQLQCAAFEHFSEEDLWEEESPDYLELVFRQLLLLLQQTLQVTSQQGLRLLHALLLSAVTEAEAEAALRRLSGRAALKQQQLLQQEHPEPQIASSFSSSNNSKRELEGQEKGELQQQQQKGQEGTNKALDIGSAGGIDAGAAAVASPAATVGSAISADATAESFLAEEEPLLQEVTVAAARGVSAALAAAALLQRRQPLLRLNHHLARLQQDAATLSKKIVSCDLPLAEDADAEKLLIPQNMRLRASTRLLQQTVLIQHLKKQQRELLPRAAAEAVEGISLLQQQQQQQFAAWQQQQQASDAFLHKLRRHMENSAEGLATRAVSLECRRSEAQKALQQLEERRRSLERQLENCLADIERVKEGLRSAHAAEEELHVDVQRQQSSSRRLERRLLQQQQQWETARDSLLLFQQAAAEAAAAQLEGAEVAAAVADADVKEIENSLQTLVCRHYAFEKGRVQQQAGALRQCMRTLDLLQQQQQQLPCGAAAAEDMSDYALQLQREEQQQELDHVRKQFLKGMQRLDAAFAESQAFLEAHADTLQQALQQQQHILRQKQQQHSRTPGAATATAAEAAASFAAAEDAEHEAEEAALAALREIAAVYRQVQQEAAPYLNDLRKAVCRWLLLSDSVEQQSHQPPAPPEEARPARDTLPCMPVAAPGVKALANPQPAGTYVVDVPPPQAPLALEAKGRETGFQFFTLDADSGPPTPAMGPADFPVQPSEQASGDGDTPAAGVALRELGKAFRSRLRIEVRGHRFRVSPDHPTDALAVRLEVVVQILKERDLSEEAS